MNQQLRRFLARNDALARLQDHASRLHRLQTALASALPLQLAPLYHVANFKDADLIIFAQSGAAAVRLKQLLPSLIKQLNASGHAVQNIKVKVTPPAHLPLSNSHTFATREISSSTQEHLKNFAASLPDDSELRAAIERLAQRARTS
jgi:hypothetical protein